MDSRVRRIRTYASIFPHTHTQMYTYKLVIQLYTHTYTTAECTFPWTAMNGHAVILAPPSGIGVYVAALIHKKQKLLCIPIHRGGEVNMPSDLMP